MNSPAAMHADARAHRDAGDAGPLAVNLLLPFARRSHWELATGADLVVTFWGRPVRRTDGLWVHQCGSIDEARAAVAAGADGVIAQGVEAGGHVRGTTPALRLTEQVRDALGPSFPVWTAGGVATRADVESALSSGAEAVVVGTRFLMSEESAAHPTYLARLVAAEETVLTELFGAGWANAPHRVVPNAATRRWLRDDPRGPRWLRRLHRATSPALALTPLGLAAKSAGAQRPGSPLLSPMAPHAKLPESIIDSGPLYAGESVRRINDVRPAGDIVAELAGQPGRG